jgi:CheY-like chemotaxis protein
MADQPLILVVDDEENFREIFGAKLAAAGFRVETADGDDSAIVKANQEKPALILMDVKMPGMDGPSVILKLRDNPELADVKFAFLTSIADPMNEPGDFHDRLSREFGAVRYFRKTDDLDLLVKGVREILAISD